mmetsp:Transcript_3616/g.6613  ORF Transcript_3616/g.6613 Transcript_3616/m.6613 type:complete len:370 (+) Transcript_3616:174-1283(+)
MQRQNPVQCLARTRLGQHDPSLVSQHHIPPPLAHAHQSMNPVAQNLGGGNQVKRFGHGEVGPLPAQKRQRCFHLAVAEAGNEVAFLVDDAQPLMGQPERGGHPLVDTNRQVAAGLDPQIGGSDRRQCLKTAAQFVEVEIEGRDRQIQRQRGADLFGHVVRGAVDAKHVDAKLGAVLDLATDLVGGLEQSRDPGVVRKIPRHGCKEREQRDAKMQRLAEDRRQPQPRDAVAELGGRRIMGRRGRAGQIATRNDGPHRGAAQLPFRTVCRYLSHDASSTSQRHSAPKLMPVACACSGVSEVGVIPGCVLTSRMISPAKPRASSHRKSVRLTPRHPSAVWARSAISMQASQISAGMSAGTTWREPPGLYLAS